MLVLIQEVLKALYMVERAQPQLGPVVPTSFAPTTGPTQICSSVDVVHYNKFQIILSLNSDSLTIISIRSVLAVGRVGSLTFTYIMYAE